RRAARIFRGSRRRILPSKVLKSQCRTVHAKAKYCGRSFANRKLRMTVSLPKVLLLPQSLRRIDQRDSMRRNKARNCRRCQEDERHGGISQHISRACLVEKRGEQSGESQCADDSQDGSNYSQAEALANDHLQNGTLRLTESQPNAELVRSLINGESHHAGNSRRADQ